MSENMLRWMVRSRGRQVLPALVLVGLLTGCNGTGPVDPEKVPEIRTYEHGVLWAQEFLVTDGFGRPQIGINPRATEIQEVKLEWGKSSAGYGGFLVSPNESDWGDAIQAGSDPDNINLQTWRASFQREPWNDDWDTAPMGTIAEGERFDYRFRVTYLPQGSDTPQLKVSNFQSVLVAPVGGTIDLAFDPEGAGQETVLQEGDEILLVVTLSRESSIQRNVRLEASPPGRIQIVDDETDQEIDRVTFEPGITYRNVQVKAVSGSPSGNLVVITAKSSGWGTSTKELTVEGG